LTLSKKSELDISTYTKGPALFSDVEKNRKKIPSDRKKKFSKLIMTPLFRAVTHDQMETSIYLLFDPQVHGDLKNYDNILAPNS
jgi:hypothetical protein